MRPAFASLLSSLLLLNSVFAADVNYNFNVANPSLSPDGFQRAGVFVNNQFPGPLITANNNDVLHINVTNSLSNSNMRRSTSIHWHGLFQHRTAAEDGAAMVSQCPIAPGHSFTYDIPLNGQAGTYWYHSHLSTQYVDGLRGPLVIYDPNDPHKSKYDVDDATTVINLDDWYHQTALSLENAYFTKDSGGDDPVPDSGLINGKGLYVKGPNVQRAVINVTKGTRYRFRVINSSAIGQYEFSIAGHRMTVIEADGVSHQPLTVDSFVIHAGQRYSVVVTADQAVGNYWVSAPMKVKNDSHNKNLDTDNIAAILRYAGAPASNPSGDPKTNSGTELSENNLVPLINPGAPGGSAPADMVVDLDFDQDKDDSGVKYWTLNDVRYQSPNLPTLLNILYNGYTNQNQFTPSEHTIVLPTNKVIEVRLHGSANGHIHPFHLHGHTFDVIQSNDGGSANYANPPRRDVVGVNNDVIIRFKTDNPGPWFLHCHMDWHLEAGLAVVFAEGPNEMRSGDQSQNVPSAWQNLCPTYQALPKDQQ